MGVYRQFPSRVRGYEGGLTSQMGTAFVQFYSYPHVVHDSGAFALCSYSVRFAILPSWTSRSPHDYPGKLGPSQTPFAPTDWPSGLSQKRLGGLIGRGRTAISAWERGQRLPNLKSALRLAKALDTLAEALYADLYSPKTGDSSSAREPKV